MNISGDAFAEELLKIQDRLYSYAYFLTHDREKAKDLLQDTLLRALDKREKYIIDNNFKGWAFKIMANIFYNNRHRESIIYSLIEHREELYQLNIPQESGFCSFNGNCTLSDINQAMDSFPIEYSTIIAMYSIGYKYEEIALFMNLPIGTVKSRIYYTRKKLQILLKDYREDL